MRGFTLIELMVVSAMMVILAGILLVQGRGSERDSALTRSAERLAFDLERVRSFAIQTRSFAGSIPCGYGIFFSSQDGANGYYLLYADMPGVTASCSGDDFKRRDSTENAERVELERGIVLGGFSSPNSELFIVFSPPRPQLKIWPAPALGNRAEIWLQTLDGSLRKKVVVEEAGEIRVE